MAPGPARFSGTREIGIIVFDDVLLLDASGPADVFSRANHHLRRQDEPDRYRVTALSTFGGEIASSSNLRLQTAALPSPDICAFDTVIVAGGPGVLNARHDQQLKNWLLAIEPGVRRLGSVCTGAYVLAESGLLNGKVATTHWGHIQQFTRLYPSVQVDGDALIAREGKLFTAAGATAGIDLALSLVDEDFGRELALEIARELVVFRVRAPGQAQQSMALAAYGGATDRLRRATDFILARLEHGVTVEEVAEHVCLGTRQLSRTFKEALGLSPNQYIRAAQVDLARELLSGTDQSLDKIALRCGFSGRQQMARAFERRLGTTPTALREH
ncbi:hypothetical protein ASB57_07610 [Bordetella sp. N]|nr:hypothetical protein ASB57_07610 [Bordetella sp. N]